MPIENIPAVGGFLIVEEKYRELGESLSCPRPSEAGNTPAHPDFGP
jgi:hypothetical protein